MLDKLWEIVLDVSSKLNVQVFATTHSKEGIESYSRVSKKLEDEDITFTILSRLNNNSIISSTRNFELFQNSIIQNRELR